MFDSAARRILYLDHSKFERRALYAHAELKVFDVIVDSDTSAENLARLHDTGFNVVVAHLLDRGSRRRIDDGENQQYTKLPELFGELALTHERARVAIFGESTRHLVARRVRPYHWARVGKEARP